MNSCNLKCLKALFYRWFKPCIYPLRQLELGVDYRPCCRMPHQCVLGLLAITFHLAGYKGPYNSYLSQVLVILPPLKYRIVKNLVTPPPTLTSYHQSLRNAKKIQLVDTNSSVYKV